MAAHFFRTNERVFNFSHTLGRMDYRGLGFRSPIDLALGNDLVYVISRAEEASVKSLGGIRIIMLTMGEQYVGDFGQYGDGDGEFRWPSSIALDSGGNVYVCDEWSQRISIYDPKGKFLARWQVPAHSGGETPRPTGLAFDRNDHLYVVDRANHCVLVFTKEGKSLHQFGAHGTEAGQFDMPWGITIDQADNVWIADWRNDRIQKLTLDGGFLASVGGSGDLPGEFNRPTGIAVDREGDVYVADWLNHRVQVFTPELRYVTSLLGDATFSPHAWQKINANIPLLRMLGMVRDLSPVQRFSYPVALEVDPQGRLVVAETGFHRLQVYEKQT